eukprot:m.128843 g.128843  ORF g.128843 m.128843 type:complete len:178 (+) comp29358_c9_seq3:67-600(+)
MIMFFLVSLFIVLSATCTRAFSPTPPSSLCHQWPPPSELSWHIHVMFQPKNSTQVRAAMQLQADFIRYFPVPRDNCSFDAGDPQPNRTELCQYEVDWEPAGPFTTAQYSFFVPTRWFAATVPFMTSRRGFLDVLVHPNSGCEIEDHNQWPMWSGNKWPIVNSAFSCEYPGCVPRGGD